MVSAPAEVQRPAPEESIEAPAPVQVPKERPRTPPATLSPASRALVAQAQAQRKKGDDAQAMASKPIREKVQAALDEVERQIKPGEERFREAQMELHRIQAQEAAQKAQEAAREKRLREEADLERGRALAAEIEANLGKWREKKPQQQRERAQDRDDGPTLGR